MGEEMRGQVMAAGSRETAPGLSMMGASKVQKMGPQTKAALSIQVTLACSLGQIFRE